MDYLKEYNEKQSSNNRNFIKQFILDHLNRRWKSKGQDSLKAVYFNRVLKATEINIETTEISILEVGGGNGDFMRYFHPNIKRKVMIDIDPFYQEEFKSMGIEFYCKDISKEKLNQVNDSCIDIIMLNHLIEHIGDIFFFMNEIKRVMKSNGIIYIRTPDIKKVKYSFYDDFTHIRPFSKNGLKHMMTTFGFKEIVTISSDNSTLKLEEYFNTKLGFFAFLGAKEIETIWKKEQ